MLMDMYEYQTMFCAVRYGLLSVYLHICVGSAHCSSYNDGHMPEPQYVDEQW